MATTFRASVRAGLKSVLDTFLAANPTLLTNVYDHRPSSINPPIAFVAGINEPDIKTDFGVRARHAIGQIVVLHRPADNDSTSDQMDLLVDGLIDAFTAAPHTVSGAILNGSMSAEDTDISIGGHRGANESGIVYASTVISVQVDIQEGRS